VQIEIHTAEQLVPGPSPFEGEIAVARIQAGGESLWSEIHNMISAVWNKEELLDQWKESIIVPVYKRELKLIVVIIIIIAVNFIQQFYSVSFFQGYVHTGMTFFGDHQLGFQLDR
jgi:hypothetical protein